MRTLCLLLLCSIVLIKATGQAGSLDPTFGKNGIQTTGFLDTANILNERGQAVLTDANGNIFVVLLINGSATRIAKYLPGGKLDFSYGNAGYSNPADLNVTSAAMQGDKIIAAGSALARYTADGALDFSFGVNGLVTTDFGGDDNINAIAIQGDKIILAGSSDGNFALARYTVDGTLDATFGVNGIVITDFNNLNDGANAIALQGDKIIAAGGGSEGDFTLDRYTADGRLDASFGVNGKVTTDFDSYEEAHSIALQGNKIILAGFANNRDFALARYTADGRLDASFGVNGKVTTDFNNSYDEAHSIAIQGDKIIAAGYSSNYPNNDFALARYTADGALDPSFGVNGKVTTDFNNSYDEAHSIALQGDKIIAAGFTSLGGNSDFALARYTIEGALDASFGEQGLLKGYFSTSQLSFTSTVIQGNKIIAAGSALVRYMADGTLDASFGVNGKATTNFVANAVILQGDKIVVGGTSALARYTADGTLDSSFGVNGQATIYFASNAIALQGDKIVVAGSTGDSSGNDRFHFALSRYTADGALDASFGVGGILTTYFSEYDAANAIAVQGDKIIVAGHGGYYDDFNGRPFLLLARYTADGALDTSFGVNGSVRGLFNSEAHAIALQGDKIILAIWAYIAFINDNTDFVFARYTADGALDTSFGVNGTVTTDFTNTDDQAHAIALQGNKIIVAGYAGNYPNNDFALARYTADGALDASFGANGKVTTHLDGNSSIQGVALQQNRLYAVGNLGLFTGDTYGAVAAYQLEGAQPVVSISDVSVSESKQEAWLTAHLSAPATQTIKVLFKTHYITAYPSLDYISAKSYLKFAPGATNAHSRVRLVDDSICEPTEQFEVLLVSAQNATIQDSIGVVTVTDDDCTITTMQQKAQLSEQAGTSLSITATPNPSTAAFTVRLQGTNLKQPVSIRVYDMRGRLLEQREHISIGQALHLGDQYRPGTYIIEATQGNRSVQTKVIKTGQ